MLSLAGLRLAKLSAPRITCEAGADGELAALLNGMGGKTTPSCVDALIEWPDGVVCVESKFTEATFGACSQVMARHDTPPGARPGTKVKLQPACTGWYGIGLTRRR